MIICSERIPLSPEERRRLAVATPPIDDVAVRKLRQRVLQTLAARPVAERNSVPGPMSPRLRRRAGAALIAAAAIAVMVWAHGRDEGGFAAAVWPVDAASSRWSQERNGDHEVVHLDEGSFYLRVNAHAPTHRIDFLVPDGVIEDLGTVLRVTVTAGLTQRVAVESGRVVVRLMDLSSTVLTAGNSWSRPVAAAPGAGTATLGGIVPAGPTPRVQSPASRVPHRRRALSNIEPQDVAYLRVLRMTSAGRISEARTAANEYLERFPNGFRSDELRRLVREEPSQGSREEEPTTRMLPRRALVR